MPYDPTRYQPRLPLSRYPAVPDTADRYAGAPISSDEEDRARYLAFLNSAGVGEQDEPMPTEEPQSRFSSGLDAASLAVLQQLRNLPPARGFGAGLAQGVAGGLAQSRAQKVMERKAAFEEAKKAARARNASADRFRKAAGMATMQARFADERQQARAELDAAKPQRERGPSSLVKFTPAQVRMLTAKGYSVPDDGYGPREWLKPERDNAPSPASRAGSYNTIIDNYRQAQDVGNFITVRDQRNLGHKAAISGTNAGDIVLMRALAKATDERTGVKEEEFKTFKGAQGAFDRVGIKFTKEMWGKGQLSPFGRKSLLDQLENTYQTKLEAYRRTRDFFRKQAEVMLIDPSIAIQDHELPDPAWIGKPPAGTTFFDAEGRK